MTKDNVPDSGKAKSRWVIRRYADEAAYLEGKYYSLSEIAANVLLNEGITEALKLIAGLPADAYSNTNAYLGVGDSNTAAAAAQTGLQAGSNKAYAAMASGYPSVSAQTVTWRAVFGSGAANFAWKEFTVNNTSSDDTGDNLNRKVSDQGTKVSGQVWTLDLQITLS